MTNLKIPGVTTLEGKEPGKRITVLAGVHGNEFPLGKQALEKILITALLYGVRKGVLNLGIGNIQAVLANERFINKDLNRCFGNRDSSTEITKEHERADELKPLLDETDILIDIHGTIKPSDPFIVVPKIDDPRAECVALLGIPTVITGDVITPPVDKIPTGLRNPTDTIDFDPVHTATYVDSKGGVGITIEAGWLGDPEAVNISNEVIAALVELGIFGSEVLEGRTPTSTELDIYEGYLKLIPGENFVWTKDWGNFERIHDGEVIAYEDDIPIPAVGESLIIFPKKQESIIPGEECGILLKAPKLDSTKKNLCYY